MRRNTQDTGKSGYRHRCNDHRSQSPFFRGLGVLGILIVSMFVVSGAIVFTTTRSVSWGPGMTAALRSPLSIFCGLVMLGSAVGLSALLCMLWRAGAPYRGRAERSQEGTIILEFALALPFALMLVLIMIQVSLLMGGNICVHYSAYCAARTAVVHIPIDDGGFEEWNMLDDADSSGKYHQIRMSAVWALMPISSGSTDFDESGDAAELVEGLRDFFSNCDATAPGWVGDYLARKLQYAQDHTQVEIAGPSDGSSRYAENEDIRVRVRHVFYLSVPYAGRLFAALDDDEDKALDEGQYGTIIRATGRMTNEGVQDFITEEVIAPTND